jgi:hypothetical protein
MVERLAPLLQSVRCFWGIALVSKWKFSMSQSKLSETCLFNGRTIRFGVRGAGPPVVVVHGTPWSSFNLRYMISELSEGFTV